MNLEDALQTIEDNMRPGITVECWMLDNGVFIRRVICNEFESYADTNAQWAEAIEAWSVLATLPQSLDEWQEKHPEWVRVQDAPSDS